MVSVLVLTIYVVNTQVALSMQMPTVPSCPLNSSTVLMLTIKPILPASNMIVTYGPPNPWTVVNYSNLEYLLQHVEFSKYGLRQ